MGKGEKSHLIPTDFLSAVYQLLPRLQSMAKQKLEQLVRCELKTVKVSLVLRFVFCLQNSEQRWCPSAGPVFADPDMEANKDFGGLRLAGN